MAFKQSDVDYVKDNVWARWHGSHDTPCNVFFAESVNFYWIETSEHFEALVDVLKQAGIEDGAPVAAFSITQKEKGWKIVQEYIKKFPKKFQTVTTGSRHGKYKVMWVFFKANGRQF